MTENQNAAQLVWDRPELNSTDLALREHDIGSDGRMQVPWIAKSRPRSFTAGPNTSSFRRAFIRLDL